LRISATPVNPLGHQAWFNARGYLDASMGYKINQYLELRLDAQNLTNTRTFNFFRNFEGKYGDEKSRIEGASVGGRTVSLRTRWSCGGLLQWSARRFRRDGAESAQAPAIGSGHPACSK
jgi:hypothetical protein